MADPLKDFFSYLENISNRGVKPGLERMNEALFRLHHPEKNYRIVHIAGTNGKGTVTSLVANALGASGYAVGLSQSPHIHDYRERMQYYPKVQNASAPFVPQLISETDLVKTHEKIQKTLGEDIGLTYFEYSIVLALQFFSDQKVDFAVLETGMGGRWDATNVCDSILSGVTTIGLDHVQHLGDTLPKILGEKQEIAKPNSDFLFGPSDVELTKQAKAHCERVGARFHRVADFNVKTEAKIPAHFFAHKPRYFAENFRFALSALQILESQGHRIAWQNVLNQKQFPLPPARFEKISDSPLIFLDGAHNEPALHVLKDFLKTEWNDEYDLVFGCLNDRDFTRLAGLIASPKGKNHWVRFEAGERTTAAEAYSQVKNLYGGEVVELNADLKQNLNGAKRTILVCGSLYLCSQFFQFWRSP
jgi:dihydrofolate synthase/folylpolyglutamate synthase